MFGYTILRVFCEEWDRRPTEAGSAPWTQNFSSPVVALADRETLAVLDFETALFRCGPADALLGKYYETHIPG
jgi:hypothetical protein